MKFFQFAFHRDVAASPSNLTGNKRPRPVDDTHPNLNRSNRLLERGMCFSAPLKREYTLSDSQDIYSHDPSRAITRDDSHQHALQNGCKAIQMSEGARVYRLKPKPSDPQDVPFVVETVPQPLAASIAVAEYNNRANRTHMEDCVRVEQVLINGRDHVLVLVADGHGLPPNPGEAVSGGAIVAERATHAVHQFFVDQIGQGVDIPKAMLRAIKLADESLRKVPEAVTCGTALIVVLVERDLTGSDTCVWVANVGDCRAILVSDGQADQISVDHAASELRETDAKRLADDHMEVRHGRIFAKEYGGLAVARTMGNFGHTVDTTHPGHRGGVSATPDIFKVPIIASDSHVVIACDGVWNFVSNRSVASIVSFVSSSGTGSIENQSKQAAMAIVQLAISNGSNDNISTVVVALKK